MRKTHIIFAAVALGGLYVGNDVWQYRQAQAAKWSQFQRFPYLSVEDEWCRTRRVVAKYCLTPGNLARLVRQPL